MLNLYYILLKSTCCTYIVNNSFKSIKFENYLLRIINYADVYPTFIFFSDCG